MKGKGEAGGDESAPLSAAYTDLQHISNSSVGPCPLYLTMEADVKVVKCSEATSSPALLIMPADTQQRRQKPQPMEQNSASLALSPLPSFPALAVSALPPTRVAPRTSFTVTSTTASAAEPASATAATSALSPTVNSDTEGDCGVRRSNVSRRGQKPSSSNTPFQMRPLAVPYSEGGDDERCMQNLPMSSREGYVVEASNAAVKALKGSFSLDAAHSLKPVVGCASIGGVDTVDRASTAFKTPQGNYAQGFPGRALFEGATPIITPPISIAPRVTEAATLSPPPTVPTVINCLVEQYQHEQHHPPSSAATTHTHPSKLLLKSNSFSNQLYRLLRLCFLRRWTWQMWRACVRVYGHRRFTRSGDEDDPNENGSYRRAAVDPERFGEMEESAYAYEDGHDSMDGHGVLSNENTEGLLDRTVHSCFDEDRDNGNIVAGAGLQGGSFFGGATRALFMVETRRRGRGPFVSLSGGFSTHDRRRSRSNGQANVNSGSAYYYHKRARDWSVAEMCRFFLTFLCCCCCCPGAPLSCGNGWVARLLYPLRIFWARHRTMMWALLICFLLLNWFLVVPLLRAGAVALLEGENIFVQRMLLFGPPAEMDRPTAPTTVVLQLALPQTILFTLQKYADEQVTLGNNELGSLVPAAMTLNAIADVRARAADVAEQSLSFTFTQQFFTPAFPFFTRSLRLQPSQLPSWTLYPVLKDCQECIESDAYDTAIAAAPIIAAASAAAAPVTNAKQSRHVPPQTQQQRTSQPTLSSAPSNSAGVVQGVYTTATSSLGRIGPMLLAIASVTDDVVISEEVTKWPWIPRVSQHGQVLRAAHRGAAPNYLAVLGIPSTDQPARAALRAAQRDTWMTYTDVARTENAFEGRLLVLYVFAASERRALRSSPGSGIAKPVASAAAANTKKKPTKEKKAAAPLKMPEGYVSRDTQRLRRDASVLLPTVAEFIAAAEVHAVASLLSTAGRRAKAAVAVERLAAKTRAALQPLRYVQRRMLLRRGWQDGDDSDSPCESVAARTVSLRVMTDANASTITPTAIDFLATHLKLPVTPLFTVPAQLVCYASAGLWKEALAHRNVVWVDMMTDRQPTTSQKKLGEEGKWGLAVEVGMSQKLILWLTYAYHAFPDVSYLIKGDDDTYLKVPQYLNDIQYIQRGRRGRSLSELRRTDSAAAAGGGRLGCVRSACASTTSVDDYLAIRSTEECIYWGSMRRWNNELYFGAGMLFLLHRRLVQSVLEDRPEYNNDVVRLAAQDYSPFYAHSYFAAMMDHEDVMVGKMLAERRVRGLQLCPYRRFWYVWEYLDRFHDMHSGRVRNVTWATVAAHRCTPVDFAYLHYFFQHEYYYGRGDAVAATPAPVTSNPYEGDVVGRRQAQMWIESQQAFQMTQGGNARHSTEGEAVHNVENNKTEWADTAHGRSRTFDARTLTAAELPEVLWTEPLWRNHTPLPYVLSARDSVAVYEVEYSPFADGYLVLDGWVSNTRLRSEQL